VTASTADGGKLTIVAVVERCMGRLRCAAKYLLADSECNSVRFDEVDDRISALQKEVKELRDEIQALRALGDEVKGIRGEISRRTDTADGIEEIEMSKRRRVEIQET
jgi:ABC-type phosphate transport system auxiliary subunit